MYRNRKKNHAGIVYIILLVVGFLLIIARLAPSVKLIQTFIYYSVYPTVGAANKIYSTTGSFADNIKDIVNVREENIRYKQANFELSDKLRNYEALQTQYESLTSLLKISKVRGTTAVFARISAREPNEWYQWFVIDKGASDGIYNGLPVAMPDSSGALCAVGRIYETYEHSAKVALITNALSAIPAEIKGKKINCLAEGFGSNKLKITYIPPNAEVEEGDLVVASPLGTTFNTGMPIAKILSVSREVATDFKIATAEILFENDAVYTAVVLVPQGSVK